MKVCLCLIYFWKSFLSSNVCVLPGEGGGGVLPINGLYGKATPERGTFFRPQVYERVGILLYLKFSWGMAPLQSVQRPKRAYRSFYGCEKENVLVLRFIHNSKTVHLQLLNGMQRSKLGIFFLTLKTVFLQQINQCKGLNWVHERGIIL